jgi:hypothetical protein
MVADVGSPKSPVELCVPVPTTVVIRCVVADICFTLLPLYSAMTRFPVKSPQMPDGLFTTVELAAPAVSVDATDPVPVSVDMVLLPLSSIERTRITAPSETNKFVPTLSPNRRVGPDRSATVAGPPSPLKPAEPVPANKLTMAAVTLRVLCAVESVMYALPVRSAHNIMGLTKLAAVAAPPLPAEADAPVPLKRCMMPDVTVSANILMFVLSVM